MLTAELIKEKAKELGADLCGIGSLDAFKGENPQRDPKMILPNFSVFLYHVYTHNAPIFY